MGATEFDPPIALVFSYDVGFAAYVSAEFRGDGEPSTVVVTKNFDGGSEIGIYKMELATARFDRARQALDRSGYTDLQVRPVPPETAFLSVGERRSGEERSRQRHFPIPYLPAAVLEVAGEFQGIVNDIRLHRSRVVGGRAAWQKATFDTREPLAVQVDLESKGPLPVVIGNPLEPTQSWSGLNLIIAKGKDRGMQDAARLAPTHLRPKPGAPESGEATLGPGGSLAFLAEKKVYLPPGDYDGLLVYMNTITRPGDPQFVDGQLFMNLGPMKIKGWRA
jgi:hypothetical protein